MTNRLSSCHPLAFFPAFVKSHNFDMMVVTHYEGQATFSKMDPHRILHDG